MSEEIKKERKVKKVQGKTVEFEKLIAGTFSLGGTDYNEKDFTLSVEDAQSKKIKHSIKCKLIKEK